MDAKDIAGSNAETRLMRELGDALRTSSAKQRLARLQKEVKLPPGTMIRLPGKPKKKVPDGQA